MSDHRTSIEADATINRPVKFTAACHCGWRSSPQRNQYQANITAHIHYQSHQPSMVVTCDGCNDVIPRRMVEHVNGADLCPECFNQVEPVPSTEIIDDLRVLAQELRPVGWDDT